MPQTPAHHHYLTTAQAAQQIGMSRFTLLRAVKSGALEPALRTPGGRLRFAPAAVERFARQLSVVAHHDPVTGMPNRVLFQDRFEQALLQAHRESSAVALLLLDPHRCQAINESMGRQGADRVLRELAVRLQEVVRASDTVARLGGDEFAILLPNTDEAGAIRVANKIRAALELPIRVQSRAFAVAERIGIAVFPEHGDSTGALLRGADQALAIAKGAGGGYAVSIPETDAALPMRQALAVELRAAIAAGELRLHYQPVVACPDGRILYAEALVRWEHPAHGLLFPDRFIPLAEQSGAITVLTLWVLEEALRQSRIWQDEGRPVPVAVNVSMLTVQESQFPDLVSALLRFYDVPASHLTLEITESTLMRRPDQALAVLNSLVDVGVRLAIDDFGIGHSSLAQLRHLPVHDLKLDRSFVRQALTAKDSALLAFILGLGTALGLTVIVEGVESQEVLDLLQALGCEAVQGFRVAHPLPAHSFDQWRSRRQEPLLAASAPP